MMRKRLPILCLLLCAGCFTPRMTQTISVADVDSGKPISGATVWKQPWAPHPFWPWGDRGVTNVNGEVQLSMPVGFWFYFEGVSADGYSRVQRPEWGSAYFYMARTVSH